MSNFVVTVDGFSSSGKGTIASMIANHFGVPHLNTGEVYRYVAIEAVENGIAYSNEEEVSRYIDESLYISKYDTIDSDVLSCEKIGGIASVIAAFPKVRKQLLDIQREIACRGKGCVLDGRDTGSIVCPDARHKFFISAAVHIRARRRFMQIRSRGKRIMYSRVLESIVKRDFRDINRKTSPLVVPDGALCFDTSFASINDVFCKVLSCF